MSNHTPKRLLQSILRGHEGAVTALHFTNEDDGIIVKPSLISGSDSGEIFIWNLKTCRSYHRFKGHNGKMILYVCFNQSCLLSQGRDGFINMWKFMNNEWTITKNFKFPNYGFCPAKLFKTEDCTYLVAPTGEGSSFTMYNYETADILFSYKVKQPSVFNGESIQETCICMKVFEFNKILHLLLGFDGGNVALWDYDSGKEISRLQCHPEVILCLDYDSKHKNRGISGSVDNILQIWKIESNQLSKVHEVTLPIHQPGVRDVKVRDDGLIVIAAGQDNVIRVFSWKTLKPLGVLNFHLMPVNSLEFCTESLFASGSKDKNICLWSVY